MPALILVVRSEHVIGGVPCWRIAWSSSFAVAGELSAPLAQEQQRRPDWWKSIIATAADRLRFGRVLGESAGVRLAGTRPQWSCGEGAGGTARHP
jgi:hypothetical protein